MKSINESSTMDDEEMTENFTRVNIGILLEDDPGWKVSEALFSDFLLCCLDGEDEPHTLQLVSNFEQLCKDQVTIMEKIIERAGPGSKFSRTVHTEQQLKAEKYSWRLLRLLLNDRLSSCEADRKNEELSYSDFDELSTDFEIFNALLLKDKAFRELKLIIEWCEQNVADQLDDSKTLEYFSQKPFLWENSLYDVKTNKSHYGEMDPDAPLRLDRKLNAEDEVDEKKFVTVLFHYIRCGQREKACDLCRHCGQAWRAAILQGSLVANDPMMKDHTTKSEVVVSGNKNRDIWKSCCWKVTELKSLPHWERALYGAVSGKLSSVLPVCTSWEDRLWAHCIASFEYIFDKALRSAPDRLGRPLSQLPFSSVDQADFNLEEIFQEVEASDDERMQEASQNPYRVIQKCLMLEDYAGVVEKMHKCFCDASEQGENPPRHLVRFVAHLMLVFRKLKLGVSLGRSNGIIELYVRQLIEDGRTAEVPYYAACLPKILRTRLCGAFLEGVYGTATRQEALREMEKVGLNVLDICKQAVENMRQRYLAETGLDTDEILDDLIDYGIPKIPLSGYSVEEKDERLAGSIEFLLFYQNLDLETLRVANSICRIFLVAKRAASAYRVLKFLPEEILSRGANRHKETTEGLGIAEQNLFKEHLCIRAYLEAHDAFGQWFQHFHVARPLEPALLTDTDVSFTEKALNEQKRKQFHIEEKRWKHGSTIYAESAVNALHGVLMFPGGWLVDEVTDDALVEEEAARVRQEQMKKLRHLCLPLVTSMLLCVYKSTTEYRKALQLAEIIASKNHSLYQVFSQSQLKELVSKLSDCGVEALDVGLDCVGL